MQGLKNELKPLLRFCKAGVKLFGGTEESTTSAQQAMGASFVEDMGTVARIYLSIAPGSALCCRFGHYCFQIQVDRNKQAILVEQVIPDEVSVALMEAVGRCEAVLEQHGWLPRDCLRIPTAKEEEQTGPGIWLRYENTKDRLGHQEILIPEPAVALLCKTVERIRTLTAPLAQACRLDRLLLSDAALHTTEVHPLTPRAFIRWLNGQMTDDGQVLISGFIHRHDIKYRGGYYPLNPHQARHTQAHKAYLAGASMVDVGDYLGHHLVGLDPAYIDFWQKQGMFIQLTHCGSRILPSVYGPCVCGDPCYIGPAGDGCDYAL